MEVLSSMIKKRRNSRLMIHSSCEVADSFTLLFNLIVARVHQSKREVLARADGLLALEFTVARKMDFLA